ncbi:hypothetical protein B7R25_14385 [Subtercola boreus]|uniref:DUF4190 domain-containing protein n=1 Tax=Subtercola boreus TaxID=120213 RepID=A0A3E0W700_9MICO|nr:hypothetical protein B7R23_14390 [Subtercola boreus]RFA18633.1 hypothetical protein B7R24_14350 [Subtercola boreus]RFA25237.1 hypothetical protein B7R25_14385 [Subtercola boreus]
MILGIVAFVGSFIPFLNFATGFVAFIGIVFGIIGLVVKHRPRKVAIAGLIISVIALILSIILAIAYTAAFASGVSSAIATASAEANIDVPIVYAVTGDGTAQINYSTYSNGTSGSESANGQTLPFEKDVIAKTGGTFNYSSFNLSAIGDANTTTITCTITVNGKVVSTQTGSGAYANASCNVSGSDLTK